MNIIHEFDTITAIATPMGTGGVGVIRISGDKSFDIINKIFIPLSRHCEESQRRSNPKRLLHPEGLAMAEHILTAGKIYHGWIVDNNKKIDEVIVLPFKNPNSYTGEDVIEIQCHGGINVVRNILDLVLKNGARLAQRGEFTKRAFLNKKIDLSQAEAVCDLIHSKTQTFAIQSAKNLSGVLAEKINEIKKDIFEVLSKIVAGIDFPEDVKEPEYEYLEKEFKEAIKKIEDILACAKSSNILRQGIKIAIVGKPNVGKSSLFNALLSLNRAIVTDIAGTTRDILTETLDFDGIPITLIDTAGIRKAQDKVEEIGVEFSKQSADEADLILFLYDAKEGFIAEDEKILDLIKDKNFIKIANKCDLITPPHPKIYHSQTRDDFSPSPCRERAKVVGETKLSLTNSGEGDSSTKISTLTKHGFIELKEQIKSFVSEKSLEDTEFITNNRQQDCLEKSKAALEQALLTTQIKELQDLISIDAKSALLFLDEITGEVITDDILNNIFDNFCIGK